MEEDSQFDILSDIILTHSVEKKYIRKAILEWDVIRMNDNKRCTNSCLCTQPHIRYEWTIKNRINLNELEPIGSTCIQRFDSARLNKQMSQAKIQNTDVKHKKRFLKRITKVLTNMRKRQETLRFEEAMKKMRHEFFQNRIINLRREYAFEKVERGQYASWVLSTVYTRKKSYIEYLIQNNHEKNFTKLIFFYRLMENQFTSLSDLNEYMLEHQLIHNTIDVT